ESSPTLPDPPPEGGGEKPPPTLPEGEGKLPFRHGPRPPAASAPLPARRAHPRRAGPRARDSRQGREAADRPSELHHPSAGAGTHPFHAAESHGDRCAERRAGDRAG